MVIDLKMCRFESCPWGFRLIGGSDFEMPLTVVKVTEGSIAELAGMKVGDVIVRINDDAASQLSHNDAHEVISQCGNNFFFGVMRESEEVQVGHDTKPIQSEQMTASDQDLVGLNSSKSPVLDVCCEAVSDSCQNDESTCPNSENQEEKLSDEAIAELISSEAEVLKDHNVIGIFPKPGVCMSSQVLRQLNDEAIKTKIEREKEKRKWTTFMQKPDRPVPKSKRELEEEKIKKANPYKVVITKQPKPRVAPDHVPTPPPTPEPENIIEEPEVEEEVKPLEDSEVPDLQPVNPLDPDNDEFENPDNSQEAQSDEIERAEEEEEAAEPEPELEQEPEVPQKTDEELILEQQLADVQKQLMALSSLPSTIQATLDAVTKQLAELLPTFRLQPPTETEEVQIQADELPQNDAQVDEERHVEETEIEETELALDEENPNIDEVFEQICEPDEPTAEELEQARREEEEERKINEELNYKKQKIDIWNRMFTGEDVSRRTFREYNSTSLAIQLERKVNFLKYQKPEKKINLEKSEVYKVIHHLDRQPKHGIEIRPSKVMAEEDIRNRVNTPISCG